MSFHRTLGEAWGPKNDPLGDTWDTVSDVITGATNVKNAVGPVLEIVKDPYFAQAVQLIADLHTLEQPSSGPSVPGVGLRHLVIPLKGYVEYRKNPWVIGALFLSVVVGIPFAMGYVAGKVRR